MDTTMALLTGLLSVVLGFGVLAAALAGAYFFGKERGRKEAAQELRPGGATADLVARTENALDALALEVERIGEAQRHAAKMLAQSAAKDTPPR